MAPTLPRHVRADIGWTLLGNTDLAGFAHHIEGLHKQTSYISDLVKLPKAEALSDMINFPKVAPIPPAPPIPAPPPNPGHKTNDLLMNLLGQMEAQLAIEREKTHVAEKSLAEFRQGARRNRSHQRWTLAVALLALLVGIVMPVVAG